MKIAFTSDLHCDISPANREILPHLLAAVERAAPDVFIVGGDVANSLQNWSAALTIFSRLPCRRLIVPGNHDLWLESRRALRRSEDSRWRYLTALPDAAGGAGFHYLPGNPLAIDDVVFVGSVGWYDYSLRDRRLDGVYLPEHYDHGEFADPRFVEGRWNDVVYAKWLRYPDSDDWRNNRFVLSTAEVFEFVHARLQEDVRRVAPGASRVVAVTHTNPFAECLVPGEIPDPFDAYEGSERLGQLFADIAGTTPVHCFCGHRHRPLDITVGGVRVTRSPMGYLPGFDGDYGAKAAAALWVGEI